MESAIAPELSVRRTTKLGLVCGMLSIVTGVALTIFHLGLPADLLALPRFAWPMLVPIALGAFTIGTAIVAVVKDQPFKQAAGLFGLGLLGIATPFVISLLLVALIVAIIIAVVAQMA